MRLSDLQFRLGALVAAVAVLALLLGGGVVAYRRFTQPPPQILGFIRRYPDQPKPELAGWGISPPLVLLFLAAPVVAIAVVVAAYRWRVSR